MGALARHNTIIHVINGRFIVVLMLLMLVKMGQGCFNTFNAGKPQGCFNVGTTL